MPTVVPLSVAVCWMPVTAVQRDSSSGWKYAAPERGLALT
jgi:hypothetical protein